MKGADAGVLRLILEGGPPSKELLRRWRGVEVATTEVALLELESAALEGPPRSEAARRTALDRLRRKVTVLPIDRRGAVEAARHMARPLRPHEILRLAEWGALEASGCDEVYTTSPPPAGKWRIRVVPIGKGGPKKRK